MKTLLIVLLVFWFSDCNAQLKVLLQNQKDTVRCKVLKFQRNYNITTKNRDYEKIWLYGATDSSLIFFNSKKERIPIHIHFSEIRTIDRLPFWGKQTGFLGVMMLVISPVVLIATPFVGIFDNWQSAKDGLVFSGVLAGGGFILFLPRLLYKEYILGKKWKLIARKM
ncbi:MAG: hypothetical protein MUE85_08625 [Microscillaceae bacterium]|jgi:hypothetical protein|nr:hypothetical protein [Microscillaceae bacterium]